MSKRERITITIRSDLLRHIDSTIDHQRVRNRSHALEVLLARMLKTDTRQAVILASGKGVKLNHSTREIPKPLIPIAGRPLLEYTIHLLREHEITDILITVSHLAEKIKTFFGNGSRYGVSIEYVEEPHPSGTGGALLAARPRLQDAPFIALYADVLINLDVTEFLQTHQSLKAAVGTIGLTSVADPSKYGAVKLRGTRVVEFSEKPRISSDVSRTVFAGISAFNPSVFDFFPSGKKLIKSSQPSDKHKLSLERHIFPELISQGRLYGFPFEGQWFDVSTPEIYKQVQRQWQP